MQDTLPASSHHQGPENNGASAFGAAATGPAHAVQFPFALPPLPIWKNFKVPTFPPSTPGGSTWSSQVEGGQGGATCFSARASTVPGSTRPPSPSGGSSWSSQVEGGQGGTTCFTPLAPAVPGSNRWGMPQDGQNCVGFSGPTAGVGGQRQQPRVDRVVGSKGSLSMDVESEPSLAQGSVAVDYERGPYSTMLQCGDGGSDMQPTLRFQSSRSLGGKDIGPPSHGGPQGVHGKADCNVADAWMGGVADIAGTQYGGCSSAGPDGEFGVQGRSGITSIDGSIWRAPAVGGGGDGEPAANARARVAPSGGGGEGEPAAKGKTRAPPGGGGGDGEPAAKGKPRSPDWSTDERVGLLTYLFQEDALQQKRKGRQKMRTRKEKYEWIISKLVEKGFEPRIVEECERKFYSLLDNGKRIRDFHLRSGERIYWNMDRVSRKKEGLPVLFDALQ
ncbi:hypothetical protein CBR_g79449 [Chara braunii]|uniref:Myb-like domain-containing protein n=1 Tax=Chara braunii TaxID=69332 RepID=A0A388JKU3_CHABU|nr:hypothetical protein CBR_g79449 [Chara braunii]|eukprot:GBG46022.1 hypothetical protein CBR_g79449 [Chara braunii]